MITADAFDRGYGVVKTVALCAEFGEDGSQIVH
jgi:hypothetical protein